MTLVGWAPYMGVSDYGVFATIIWGKWLWWVGHHTWGQMTMAHQSPYPSANMVHLSPSTGENDYGELDTIHGGKWLRCISHHSGPVQVWCIWYHALGQMAIVSGTPYMEANNYGASITITQCKCGAFVTIHWGKWLWWVGHHTWRQVTMVHQSPYPNANMVHLTPCSGENGYSELDTIYGGK